MKARFSSFVFLFFAIIAFANVFADDHSTLQVSSSSVSIKVGASIQVTVSNASGSVSAKSNEQSIVSASYASGKVTLKGLKVGSTTVEVKDRRTTRNIVVSVVAATNLTVSPTSVTILAGDTSSINVSNASGSVSATSNNTSVATVSYSKGIVTVKGEAAGNATITVRDSRSSKTVAVTVKPKPFLTVNPAALSLNVNATAQLVVTNASGSISAISNNTAIASVSNTNGVITVRGVAAGSAIVTVKDSSNATKTVAVTVKAINGLTVTPSTLALSVGGTSTITVSNATGTVSATSNNGSVAKITSLNGIYTVKGVSAGTAIISIKDSLATKTVNVTVTNSSVSSSGYTLLAWNDLGMHCMDGLDYSIFAILPPYNSLHAQLKDKAGKLITSGVTLTYEAVADSSGSINTYSAPLTNSNDPRYPGVYKTNFWDKIGPMLGLPPNTPPKDTGLNLDGMLSGKASPGNPAPSLKPAPLTYNSAYQWWEAEGIPITPVDDAGKKNFYPTVKVVAKDSTGKELARTTTVLPVSDEMTCKACHATTTSNNVAANAAKPSSGWINDPDPEKDWKKNILRLHDDKKLATKLYQDAIVANGYKPAGLLATAESGKPILCVGCHLSYAYTDKAGGDTVMKGYPGIRPYTQVLHSKHASVKDPTTGSVLDDINNRTSCYLCHPGSETQCLRGAMSKAVDSNTGNLMSCQSCHGNLSAVGHADRKGWLEEPTCQSCHNSGMTNKRAMSVFDSQGKPVIPTDKTFATNDNKPLPSLNLYRFSKGHGGLQCEACHGSTHAEYPSTHLDDNTQSKALQGHEGTIAECTACHTTVPTTVNGGPHGMHTTGNAWVSAHQHANKNGTSTTPSCAYCHGTTSAGTPLSAIKVAKTISAGEFGTKNWPAGYQVSCYSCHNGPNPD